MMSSSKADAVITKSEAKKRKKEKSNERERAKKKKSTSAKFSFFFNNSDYHFIIERMSMQSLFVYGSLVYKYMLNTLRHCINSADIPDAWLDQFFHRPCWTADAAAPHHPLTSTDLSA